jgi:hypothetical protein
MPLRCLGGFLFWCNQYGLATRTRHPAGLFNYEGSFMVKKIVIQVRGGVVQYVCTNDRALVVVLHDEDSLSSEGGISSEERERIFDAASDKCAEVTVVNSTDYLDQQRGSVDVAQAHPEPDDALVAYAKDVALNTVLSDVPDGMTYDAFIEHLTDDGDEIFSRPGDADVWQPFENYTNQMLADEMEGFYDAALATAKFGYQQASSRLETSVN